MEDTLGDCRGLFQARELHRLNPCSNGRYSRSYICKDAEVKNFDVLILVLMEDTLGDKRYFNKLLTIHVLILVLMEDTLGGLDAGKLCFRQGESSKTYKLELC